MRETGGSTETTRGSAKARVTVFYLPNDGGDLVVQGNNIWSTAMKFIWVKDRAPHATSKCAYCSMTIGIGYLRDLTSDLLYCDFACYCEAPVVMSIGAGIDSLPMTALRWASDLQRVVLDNWNN
jgi:hypothetical protein